MANLIISSCKPQLTSTAPRLPISPTAVPKCKKLLSLRNNNNNNNNRLSLLGTATTTASAAIIPFLLTPLPALAEEFEKAALFDFNLTLPIIMVEFLLLMFALDKIYFTPLGKFMDERDAAIREKLSSVKDTSEEVKQLEEQAAAVMRAARAEISAALNKMKKETQAEVDARLAEGRKKVEMELREALGNLEKQKEGTIRALDSQITALSQEIVRKVLPTQ